MQIESSCAFATCSWFAHWVYGGLNFQVVHHLFPDLCHIHLRDAYPIVLKHCLQSGIQVIEFFSFISAIISHYQQIYLLGQRPTQSA